MSEHASSPAIVSDRGALAALAEALARAPRIAIDTEFVRERTYYPKLCVLQVASDDVVACVDCLAEIDLEPLFQSLFRPDCEWVLHSARQDLEIFWNARQSMPQRLFDTQLAAALLGCAPQIGLQELAASKLGVELDKTLTRTDWSRRPLPPAALEYALDDVRYLLELARRLERELAEVGREHWHAEDAARSLATLPVSDAITIWQRLKAVGGMAPAAQAAALALVRWREMEAQRFDRPRRWILDDEALARIARALPEDPAALRNIADLPKKLVERSSRDILAAVAASATETALEEVRAATQAKPDKAELKALQDRVRVRAEALNIHAEVLATRRELAAYLAGEPPRVLTEGWRAAELAR